MDKKDSRLDNFSDGEFTDIRRKLRLSSWWKVTSVHTSFGLPEFPDTPDGVSKGTDSWKTERLGRTTIRIEASRRRRYHCPNCGKLAPIYQIVRRRLTHLQYLGYDCILDVGIPKLDCDCGKHRIPFPAARDHVSYTIDFEKEVLRGLLTGTVAGTARRLGIGRWIAEDILMHRVNSAFPEQDLSGVHTIYLDETQFSKGRNSYVTVICDQTHRVIFMTPGKTADTLERFLEHLKAHGGKPSNIRTVSADLSVAYESAVRKYLRHATLVFDRFHVVKLINTDMDAVRKRLMCMRNERSNRKRLPHVMYTLFMHEKNMDERHHGRLEEIRLMYPGVAQAYDMKETFCRIYECENRQEAEEYFEEWYNWVWYNGPKEFRKRAEFFRSKLKNILSWFDEKVSNAVAESMNSMIQKTKAAACGYTNLGNFISMCFFRFGRLTIRF